MRVFVLPSSSSITMSEDLTNLNWLSCAPIEISSDTHQIISVKYTATAKRTKTTSKDKLEAPNNPRTNKVEEEPKRARKRQLDTEFLEQRKMNRLFQRTFHKRPQCSYSCLITMALKASDTGSLPVHLIYKYIEQEFPYFRTAPEGWKNSIRHNLSMNQNFIKVCRNEIPSTKKGFLWSINPSRMDTLDQEIEKTLKAMDRKLIENGEDKIPKQFSRNCKQLFSARAVPSDATPSAHFPSPCTPRQHQTYSRELYECVSRHVSLKTLNSISGLKLRDRKTGKPSKMDRFPLFPERQTSSEALTSLFGVSILPDTIEEYPTTTDYIMNSSSFHSNAIESPTYFGARSNATFNRSYQFADYDTNVEDPLPLDQYYSDSEDDTASSVSSNGTACYTASMCYCSEMEEESISEQSGDWIGPSGQDSCVGAAYETAITPIEGALKVSRDSIMIAREDSSSSVDYL